MDIQKYIDSGILEDYALGLVSEAEVKDIEQKLKQYTELETELINIKNALATYAQAKAMPMPAGLSNLILQSIQHLEISNSPSNISDSDTF